jgi:hypothetical protein
MVNNEDPQGAVVTHDGCELLWYSADMMFEWLDRAEENGRLL